MATTKRATKTAAPAMSSLIAVLESAWANIRRRHPEVPAAVIVVGQGSDRKKGLTKYGHHAADRWETKDGRLPEVMVSGEGLSRTAEEIFTTLVHEAAHGVAHTRGVKDTSGQGNRYHTQAFADIAVELGLVAPGKRHDRHGYSDCTLAEATAETYKAALTKIAAALIMFRHAETAGEGDGKDKPKSRSGVVVRCSPVCGRQFTIAPRVLALGPIQCQCCFEDFIEREADEETSEEDDRDEAERFVADHVASLARIERLRELLDVEIARADEALAAALDEGLTRRDITRMVKAAQAA